MRRRHKIFYWIQDCGDNPIWFKYKYGPGTTNVKTVYTLKAAVRVCSHINSKGGLGLITRFAWKKGRRRAG